MEKVEWSALDYEEKERGIDWFWALGIIIAASSLAAIIYHNYFFAALLVLSGILLGFFAVKKPDLVHYELNDKGLKIKNRLYPYKNIKSFWVRTGSAEEDIKPLLFIKTERLFMPTISIPIEDETVTEVYFTLLEQNITEEEMKEHVSEKIMDYLGF